MSLRKAFISFFMLLATAFAAQAQSPGYALVSPPQPTDTGGGKIEVIEFFWYGCPHCYHLEPAVNAWLARKPADVVFKRVPAAPSQSWAEAGRIFYTLQAMGLLEKLHDKVFDAIHKDGVNLMNQKIRDQWLAKNGVDPVKYQEVSKSFTVATDLSRARQLTLNYKVDSVPRLIVNGKYYVSAELAGSAERMFPVVDELIAKIRAGNGKSAPAAKTK